MKLVFLRSFLFFSLILSSCEPSNYDPFPVIGLDKDGNPAQILVPKDEYKNRLQAVTESLNDSTLLVLSRKEQSGKWKLTTLVVGFGVNTQIGIGPFQVGAFPRMRLVYSCSENPTLP